MAPGIRYLNTDLVEYTGPLKNARLRHYPARSPSRERARSCFLLVATAPSGLPARTAGERLAGASVNGILQTQLISACLREARLAGQRQGHF
jgi:hypothetical protein